MNTQFIYNRSVAVEGSTETTLVQDSFNITKVIRTMTIEDNKLMVLLDDLHERVQEVPEINPKTGKIGGMRRERNTFQSEIHLDKEDGARFLKLTGI